MKVHLDRERCQGHGRCYALAAGVYEPDDDGYGFVVSQSVPAELQDLAVRGAKNCPEDGITIEDDE